MNNPKSEHNQPVLDPIAHFKAIPWCNTLLSARDNVSTQVPDRRPIGSTERSVFFTSLQSPEEVRDRLTPFQFPCS